MQIADVSCGLKPLAKRHLVQQIASVVNIGRAKAGLERKLASDTQGLPGDSAGLLEQRT
jgi:hypothetical protein